jgi:PBSX family phage terminase large subunit
MTAKQAPDFERKQAIRELWRRGILDYKRRDNQKVIRDFIRNDKRDIITILASRRQGKSYDITLQAVELCQTTPDAIVKYICPRLKMVKTIVMPNIKHILKDCPLDMQPEWKENDKMYIFPNGSQIQFAGTDNGSHENLRGGAAHLCIVDEAGFCDHLEYVVNSVLAPTTDTTGGKVVLISTPSKTSQHDFIIKFVKPAEAAGTLLKLTIYDNPTMTNDKIRQIASRYPSGMDDPQFKREYLCEIVSDEDAIVIPEFSKNKKELVTEWPRPRFFDSYTSGDVGFKDLTVYLFAYWDFMKATLVIEDELVMNGPSMTTERLAEEIRKHERDNFHDTDGNPLPIYLRVMDNNLIMVNDLARLHNLNFIATAKDDKEAQINQVRMMFANGQIVIHPRCKHLIYHLENAMWDKNHKSFTRLPDTPDFSIKGGHADAVDALIYLVRNLVRSKNPYPADWGLRSGENIFQSQIKPESSDGLKERVFKMLNISNKN